VTCSSDTTIKLWNVVHQKCLATLTEHTDYVKALAYASDRSLSAHTPCITYSVYKHIHMYMHICLHIHTCIYLCVCIHIYIYTSIHI